ncbi:putative F-box domain, leucine-rich repeat domain superfamily, F-box-like domain superfamily [Helianthus annuus]|nr:putative F-box domain, leucine-rich repeat domain superfamily, F-box-like domain superfamily [Helianthus annuus]
MPALVNYRGDDDYHTGGSLCSKDSTRLLSFYGSPCKRQRISDSYFHFLEEEKKPSIEVLPDEILYEIFRRLSGGQARSAAACVSSRWLTVLSNVRTSEMVHDVHEPSDDVEMVQENDGFLTRCLEGKKATDRRLQSVAVGTSARGGLGKLSVRGSNKVTKIGLTAIAHGCPSLKVLSLWNVPSIGDESLIEISKECRLLEKLDLSHCNSISNKGISAIAQNCPNLSSLTIESCINVGNESLQAVARCCPNLQSITIKDCPNVGDQGVATLLSSLSSVLKKVKLQSLNITDFSLAVIGHYGITDSGLYPILENCQAGLVKVNLSNCLNLTDKVVVDLAKIHGETLKVLNLEGCRRITDESLASISDYCFLLSDLDVSKCCVTDNGLRCLSEGVLIGLQILSVSCCSKISNKSAPFLKKLGQTLVGLNIQQCNLISSSLVDSLVENLWRCDILY